LAPQRKQRLTGAGQGGWRQAARPPIKPKETATMSIPSKTTAVLAVLVAVAIAQAASAQTYSGGRQGPHGRGYTYNFTRNGGQVTGSVETNRGYGATVSHTGGYNAYGAYRGTSTINTNNGSTITTHGYANDGFAAGTVTATGPGGQTVSRGGAVYVPY
jgi:hypothetical protein